MKSILLKTVMLVSITAALVMAHLVARFVWASGVRTQGLCETHNFEPGVVITIGNFRTCEPGLLKENALWHNFWNLPGINPMEFALVHLAAAGLVVYVVSVCVAWRRI